MKRIQTTFTFFIIMMFLSCDNALNYNQDSTNDPDITKVFATITSINQTYTLPASYYTEKTNLQNTANSQIASWQDLYEIGAITGTVYEEKVSEINVQLAIDIAELETTYLATDIYNNVNISFNTQNDNDQVVSVIVYLKVITTDSNQFQDYKYITSIPSGAFLSNSISISTSNKKYQTVTITNIIFQ